MHSYEGKERILVAEHHAFCFQLTHYQASLHPIILYHHKTEVSALTNDTSGHARACGCTGCPNHVKLTL